MAQQADPGLEVIEYVYEKMLIDDEWSDFERRGFTWWGHKLAQRVWAETPRRSHGMDVVRVRAQTQLVRNVPQNDKTATLLSRMNHDAVLSSVVFDRATDTIVSECSMYVHQQNVELLKWVFMSAVAIQAAEAPGQAVTLMTESNSPLAMSEHPSNGSRPYADDMLNVIGDVYVPRGNRPPSISGRDFQAALDLSDGFWVMANAGETGLTAEFAFSGPIPVIGNLLGKRSGPETPETALLTVTVERHPRFGFGLLGRLTLPNDLRIPQHAGERLNVAEATAWTGSHLLGGWCMSSLGLTFPSFLPTATCWPGAPLFMVQSMALRAKWVNDEWLPGGSDPTE